MVWKGGVREENITKQEISEEGIGMEAWKTVWRYGGGFESDGDQCLEKEGTGQKRMAKVEGRLWPFMGCDANNDDDIVLFIFYWIVFSWFSES